MAFDPDAVPATPYGPNAQQLQQHANGGLNKLSLAVDFVVQGDGAFTAPTKYGPVIVPHLEFGR